MISNVKKKKNYFALLTFIVVFISFASAGTPLVGGNFETFFRSDTGVVNPNWQFGICRNTSPLSTSNTFDPNNESWRSNEEWSTLDLNSSLCNNTPVSGVEPGSKEHFICLGTSDHENSNPDGDCVSVGIHPAAPDNGVFLNNQITSTEDRGNDFNITAYYVNAGIDINYFTINYDGTTEINQGDILSLDLNLNLSGGVTKRFHMDNLQLVGHTLTVTEPIEPIPSRNSFEIRATVQDVNGDFIETADVNITLNGDTNAMAFSNDAYRITFPLGLPSGVFPFDVNSNSDSVEKGFSGSLIVSPDFREVLNVTNINNTTFGVDFNVVSIEHSSFNKESQTSFAYQTENTSAIDTINVVYKARGSEGFTFNIDPLRNFLIFTRDDSTTEFQLNDSLTFSIDRLWDNDLDDYLHFFEDPLSPGASRQYKLDFKTPFIQFTSFEDQTLFTIGGSSLKKVQKDDRTVDQFSINKFSRLIINQTPDFGTITSTDTPNTAYVVSFTASVNEGTLNLTADGDTETVTTQKKTVYFDVQGDFNITSEVPSGFRQLEVENIVMMERGFFTKELEVFDEFGNDLPVIINDLNQAKQVLEEGQKFMINTQLYERGLFEGQDLNLFIIEAFAFGVTDENKLISKTVEILPQDFVQEVFIEVNEIVDGLITTEPSLPTLTPLKIQIQACGTRVDTDATSEPVCYATQETQEIVLRQFPFSSDQILLTLGVDEFFVGENPEGAVFIETNFIETIQSVTISVFKQGGSVLNSDANETFFKGTDFQCVTDFCSFGWRLDQWAFEEATDYLVQATVKVTTSELDFNNPLLNKIEFLRSFHIEYKETFLNLYNKSRDARIFLDHEKIPMIVTLRDNLNLPSRDDLNIFFRVWDLGTSDFNGGGDADPTFIQLNFNWDIYEYDINSGRNRYAFVGRPREQGGALQDGHFYRLAATVDDHTKKRIQINPITLSADKSTGGFDSDTNAFQQSNEVSIKIDNTAVIEAPLVDQNGFLSLTCLDAQTGSAENILRVDELTRTIDAGTALNPLFPLGYFVSGGLRFASSVINDLFYKDCHLTWVDRGFYVDTIRIYVYNSYSDLTEQNPEFQQFMTFTIKEDTIIFNDGKEGINDLIRKSPSSCKTEFLGDSLGQYLCAVGTEGNGQTRELAVARGEFIDDILNFFTGTEDLNTIATINPETRYLKFQINNLRPKNVIDFQEVAEIDFTGIPDTKILKFLKQDQGLRIVNEGMANIDIFQNGRKIKTIQLENNLYDRLIFNQFADQNGLAVTPFEYFIRADLCFNSGRNCLDPQIIKFSETVSLKRPNKPITVALGACFANFETIAECSLGFFSTPEVFVVAFGGFILFIILIFIVVLLKSPRARSTVFNIPGSISRGLRRRRR